MPEFALEINDLRISYGDTEVVKGVSLQVEQGQTLGLVGESGCGKSSIGRAIVGLVAANAGAIKVCGQVVDYHKPASLAQTRRQVQMIFQDPQASLNPRSTIAATLAEPLAIHNIGTKAERVQMVANALEEVEIDASAAKRYPHEFSTGQRQRIAIARALMLRPSLVVADEPVSALDVSVQAHVLNLLQELQHKRQLSYLFISHDLAVVAHMCPQVIVMNQGAIVEAGPREQILHQPQDEYTQLLLAAATG